MDKNEYLESVELNTGVEMIPCESSNVEATDTTPKTNNFGLLSKATKFTVMMVYLKKSAMNYT